jgi:hypothetical protein
VSCCQGLPQSSPMQEAQVQVTVKQKDRFKPSEETAGMNF